MTKELAALLAIALLGLGAANAYADCCDEPADDEEELIVVPQE